MKDFEYIKGNPKPRGRCVLHCKAGSSHTKAGDFSWRYDLRAMPAFDVSPSDVDALLGLRKSLYNDWQEMLALQKACGKQKLYDAARTLKGVAAGFKKRYLGVCYLIGWVAPNASGDCPAIDLKDIPQEIFPQVDSASDFLYLLAPKAPKQ